VIKNKLWLTIGLLIPVFFILILIFTYKLGINPPPKFDINENDFDILNVEYTKISTIEKITYGSVRVSLKTNRDNLVISVFHDAYAKDEVPQRCFNKFESSGFHTLKSCGGDPPLDLTIPQINKEHNFRVCASSPWDIERSREPKEICKSITLPPYQE